MANIAELKKDKTALAEMKPKEQVKYLLEKNKSAIAAAAPRHFNAERLLKVAQTAVTTTPALLECYLPTLLGGIIQCGQMGLEPNTVLGHAYLVPFRNKKKNRQDVQILVGYKGLIDLARRSGQVQSIAAHAVRKGDLFEFQYGLEEKLRHIPAEGERGEITHFYAVAHMKDGGHAFEVMTKKQVEKIRDSGNRNPVWSDHFEEMGRKTAIRRLAKYLPLSVEFATGIAQDGQIAPELDAEGSLSAEFAVVDDEGGNDAVDSERVPSADHGTAGAVEGVAATGDSEASESPAPREVEIRDPEPPSATPPSRLIEQMRACKSLDTLGELMDYANGAGYSPTEAQAVQSAYNNRKEVLEASVEKEPPPAPRPATRRGGIE